MPVIVIVFVLVRVIVDFNELNSDLHSTPHTPNSLTIRKKHGCRLFCEPTPVYLADSECIKPPGVGCRVFLSSLRSAKYAFPVYNDEMTENLFFAPTVSRIVASYIYETGYGLRSRDNFLEKRDNEGCEDYEFQNLLTSIETNVFGLQWIILNLLQNKQV